MVAPDSPAGAGFPPRSARYAATPPATAPAPSAAPALVSSRRRDGPAAGPGSGAPAPPAAGVGVRPGAAELSFWLIGLAHLAGHLGQRLGQGVDGRGQL